MSDSNALPVGPVQPVGDVPVAQPVGPEKRPVAAIEPRPAPQPRRPDVAAATTGNLAAAYAQFIINPDTHDVVIRVKDAVTGEVISEYPSRQIEELAKYMKQYADTLARLRGAQRNGPTN